MKKCESKIAILLATYNGEKYIKEQIESLLSQSFQDFSIYIHDDGSKDNTCDILHSYSAQYPDKIIILPGNPTGGPKQNFMFLLNNVDARYYMFCDQDDYWKQNKVEDTYKKMLELEDDTPILVFTDLEVADSSLKTISPSMNKMQCLDPNKTRVNDLLCQNNITGCTVMINRILRDLSLKVCDINNIIMHDWWLALVAARYGKIVYCDKQTILYRQHAGNNVGAKSIFSIGYVMNRLKNIHDLRKSIDNTRIQAREFCDCFGELGNELVSAYSELGNKGKTMRLYYYIKNNVWKNGFVRNIGFAFFG